MAKYCNRAWKKCYFCFAFSKTAETILIKIIGRNQGISVYKKALISKQRKNDIFRDNKCFVKMSVSMTLLSRGTLVRYQNFVDLLAQKLV